jgi:hypothetical protein
MESKWVYGYEIVTNAFIGVFDNLHTNEKRVFIINNIRNDFQKLIAFFDRSIKNKEWHYGFNCNVFEAQITEYLYSEKTALSELSADNLSLKTYLFSQEILWRLKHREPALYHEDSFIIPTVDIYKLNNWDSEKKYSPLKWIQYTMGKSIEDIPYQRNKPLASLSALKNMAIYCSDEVSSIKDIFLHKDCCGKQDMLDQIKIRTELSEKYQVNLYSASEPKICKEVFTHFLSLKMGISKQELSLKRTCRNEVQIKDVILPHIKFDVPEFRSIRQWANSLSLKVYWGSKEKENGPKYVLNYNNVLTTFAMGGIHGCTHPGVYDSSDGKCIVSIDAKSYYANLILNNKWSPKHIPEEIFSELYEWFYQERERFPEGSSENYLFKTILTSTYGLSNSIYSLLCDHLLAYSIVINGQLSLAMLYEWVITRIPNSKALTQNTDGMEFIIPTEHRKLFEGVCSEWEGLTRSTLKILYYDKMVVSDVNNYIAVCGDSVKSKGKFEYENLPLHKSRSFLVIAKALHEYFIHGIPPEEYLFNNNDILDYCAGIKPKDNCMMLARSIVNGKREDTKIYNVTRYYISLDGVKLVKRFPDFSEMEIMSDLYLQTPLDSIENKPFEEYHVNKQFYLQKIKQEIIKIETPNKIVSKPKLTLF